MKGRFVSLIVILLSVYGIAAVDVFASTLVVTKTADTADGVCDADCSLREAVVLAASGDKVIFSELFTTPQTITLTLGEMAFTKDLTIVGTGRGNVIVSANNASRIFYVFGGGHLSASGMTLRDGNVGALGSQHAFGGAILLSDSFLVLTDVLLTNNRAFHQPTSSGGGGAIYGHQSNISLSNSSAIANTGDGAIIARPTTIGHLMGDIDMFNSEIKQNVGGGVSADALTVSNCVVSGNSGGLGLRGQYATISDSIIIDNGGVGILGGDASSTMSIERCLIGGNRSFVMGGGLSVSGITIVKDTQFVNNIATGGGGGIFNTGELYVISSAITGNTSNASFSGVDGGGGIRTLIGRAFIINSTISGNTAFGIPGAGGGIYVLVNGGNPGGRLYLVNSTITNNTAQQGGGGVRIDAMGVGEFANTIGAGNTSTGTTQEDVSGTIISDGHNLVGTTNGSSGWTTTDLLNVNPLLAPLGNNGNNTLTHALLPGSLAINAGNNALALDPQTMLHLVLDQRGRRRFAGTVDIGAYEASFFAPPVDIALFDFLRAESLLMIGGKVSTADGRGISGARVTLTEPGGTVRYAVTNPFGHYRFNDLTPGTTYTVTATSKSYQFTSPQIVTADQNRSDLDFGAFL